MVKSIFIVLIEKYAFREPRFYIKTLEKIIDRTPSSNLRTEFFQ